MSTVHPHYDSMCDMLKIYQSMQEACALAGGLAPALQTLEEMNGLELLALLAPNGVRFCQVKEHKT